MSNEIINKTIDIIAPTSLVWQYLTTPNLIKQWMFDTDMEINIYTDWKVGNPFILKGYLHQIAFENKGTILEYTPEKVLQYSQLSSISLLPDNVQNYSIITFELTPSGNQTKLTLNITNFPTISIFKHLEFYWENTIVIMKKIIEEEIYQ